LLQNNLNNDLAKFAISILANSDKKMIFDIDFKIVMHSDITRT